jgi:flagellar basal-body rod modification protein FlgD
MTDIISAISSNASAQATRQAAGDQAKLVSDYSDFLTLLTAQLQNQNPLEPMDSKEFTNQLTQFSSVEQSIQSNNLLEQMIASSESSLATSLVGYLGNTIRAEGNATKLDQGAASWSYNVDGAAENVSIKIRNSAGAVVFEDSKVAQSGVHDYPWDGRTKTGNQLPDGIYSLTVTAEDTDGLPVPVSTEITGKVDGVDMSGAVPVLSIGSATIPISAVKAVSQ